MGFGASGWRLGLTDPVWLWGLAALPLLAWWLARGLVNQSRGQMVASLACRAPVVTLIVLILSGLILYRPTREPFVVFAVDRSLSIGDEAETAARDYLDKVLTYRGSKPAAFLGFATVPGAALPDRSAALRAIVDDEARMGTDLDAAVAVAAGAIPPGYVPRVVMLSDGNATTGEPLKAAVRSGAEVWTVPLSAREEPEVQVAEVKVPTEVREGESFPIEVVVNANQDDEGILEIFCNGTKMSGVSETRRKVRAGENRFQFQYRLTHEKQARIQARVTGFLHDTLYDDNSARGLVHCLGRPRVLIVDSDPKQAENLVDALTEGNIQVDPPRPPEGLPDSRAELMNYDLVILANVPATHPKLTQKHFQELRFYVQELGGGLLLLGGDHAFGPGGYARSSLEDLLPVYCDFRKEREKPKLAMVLVLDKSNSMAEGVKLPMVKEAARGAVELLAAKDQVGVVAFDTNSRWVSKLRSCDEKGQVFDSLAHIGASGGTLILPALELAYQALDELRDDVKFKHILLLSDGGDNERGIEEFTGLLDRLSASRITVSCVGVGSDVHIDLLKHIAQRGGGRSYFPEDIASVPQIFAQETIQATKDALTERPFKPIVARPSKVLSGIDWSEAPELNGYVMTRIKVTSEQILITDQYDPLLAWWRTGLGMCGAFTSDAQSRWAEPWITNWPSGYSRFWTQVARHLMRRQDAVGSEIRINRHGRRVGVTLDAVDPYGEYLNDAETNLTVFFPPRGDSLTLEAPQTAPGRYLAEFDAPVRGDYWLLLTQKFRGKDILQQTRGLAIGYADELRLRPTNEELLREIATATGGQFRPDPQAVFTPSRSTATRTVVLWPHLATIVAILLVVDVVLRRLEFGILAASLRSGISLVFRLPRHRGMVMTE